MSRFFLCFFMAGLLYSTDVLAFGGSRQEENDRGFYGVHAIGAYYGGKDPASIVFQPCPSGVYLKNGVCYNPCDEVLILYPDSDCQNKEIVNNSCQITPVQDGTPCGLDIDLVNATCHNGFCVVSSVDDNSQPGPSGDNNDDENVPPVPPTPPEPDDDDGGADDNNGNDESQTCNVTDYRQCPENQILDEVTHCCVDCPEGMYRVSDANRCSCGATLTDCGSNQILDEVTHCCVDCPEGQARAQNSNTCACSQTKYQCADNQIFDEETHCCVDCPEGLVRYHSDGKYSDSWDFNVCACRDNGDCLPGEFCNARMRWDDNDVCYVNVVDSKCEPNNDMKPGSSMSGFILSRDFELTHQGAINWCASHNKRLFAVPEFGCYRHRSADSACLYEGYGSCGMDNPNSNNTHDNWDGGIGSGCCCSATQSCGCGNVYNSIQDDPSSYSDVAVQLYNQFGSFHAWTSTLHDNYRCGYFYFSIGYGSDLGYSTGAGHSHNALCQ